MFNWFGKPKTKARAEPLKSEAVSAVLKSDRRVTLSDVFVPGGKPTITYVPRSELGLEDTVRDHIRETREILLLIGPTKSGKSVLTQTVIPDERRVTVDGTRVRDRAETSGHRQDPDYQKLDIIGKGEMLFFNGLKLNVANGTP